MRAFLVAIVTAGLTAACSSASPSAPSSSLGASGATITGSVVGASASAVAAASTVAADSFSGITVTVPGTDITAAMNTAGFFTLTGVPDGDVELRFAKPGFSAALTLSGVESTDTINITISVGTNSVALESEQRTSTSGVQIEGRVESLPPTVPASTFVVAGRPVATTAATEFRLNGATATFASLAIGQRVHVEGEVIAGGLTARRVDIQNTNTDIQIPINGTVQGLIGPSTAFSFTINGRLIKGDALTEFFGGSDFTDLVNGARAEVKGLQRDGYVYASRIHVNVEEDDADEIEASVQGVATSITGGAPALTLVIDGTTVKTSAATTVQRKGDDQVLSVLVQGMTLHATGLRQPDGSIAATKIQIKDDAAGGAFLMNGSMGGVKGTCPSLTFNVSGYDIVTDAATTFASPCSGFTSGTKVTVRGVVQAGGTVKATSLAKQ